MHSFLFHSPCPQTQENPFVGATSDVDVIDDLHGDVAVKNSFRGDDFEGDIETRIGDGEHRLAQSVPGDHTVLAHFVAASTGRGGG